MKSLPFYFIRNKSYTNLNYRLQKLKRRLKNTPTGTNSVQFLNVHAEGLTEGLQGC
jgi:hypothetical protein